MNSFWNNLPRPFFCLAPLADVTDAAFRRIIAKYSKWGGEEIIVALLGVNESGAKKKADQIRKSVERLSFNNLPDIQVTVSTGVSSFEAGNNFDEIINRADKALYQAKEGGRNKVISWTELSTEITKVKPW